MPASQYHRSSTRPSRGPHTLNLCRKVWLTSGLNGNLLTLPTLRVAYRARLKLFSFELSGIAFSRLSVVGIVSTLRRRRTSVSETCAAAAVVEINGSFGPKELRIDVRNAANVSRNQTVPHWLFLTGIRRFCFKAIHPPARSTTRLFVFGRSEIAQQVFCNA